MKFKIESQNGGQSIIEEDLRENISDLQRQQAQFKEQRDSLNRETKHWIEEKRKKQQLIRQMKDEALKYKTKRDELNLRAKEIKAKLKELNDAVSSKFKLYNDLKVKIEEDRKPIKTRAHSVEEEFENLEWKIQTTPFNPIEEKTLTEQVKELESQVVLHRKLKAETDKLKTERAKVDLMKSQIKELRIEITETAEESRINHQKMLEVFTQIDQLRKEVSLCHEKFLEIKSQADAAHKKYLEIVEKQKEFEKKIDEERRGKESKKALETETVFSKIAEDKFKAGSKVTFEEFKLLIEKGKIKLES